jgi:hypothetical protein
VKSYTANLHTPDQSTTCSHKRRATKILMGITALVLISASNLMAQINFGFLPNPVQVASTVPPNGDVNPYGVAFVPSGFPGGVLSPGDVLVSNFNNNQNLQGTGTTIVRVPPQGSTSVFFTASPGQPGLSTALGILQEGLVIVGSFPSIDGTCATAGNGALLVINSHGQQIQTISDEKFINGPWDMAVYDAGTGGIYAFVTNGLTGTVTRLKMMISGGMLTVQSKLTIASGYGFQCDPVTFVDAPTGLVYDHKKDLLYVASTVDNTVYAVSHATTRSDDAGRGQVIYQDQVHLHGPLGMAAAPSGDLLVSNNDVINPDPNQPSEIVEFTITGHFVKQLSVDPNFGGSFGLNVQTTGLRSKFAAVDDNQSNISIWTLPNNP